ncbi:MAG: Uma2 family endonuclease [Micromonosporaceae bacterium]
MRHDEPDPTPEVDDMTTAAIQAHGQPWTEEAYFALGETRDRIELFDGSLIVTPAPSGRRQHASRKLANAVETPAAEQGLEVVEAVNVRLGTGRVVIPDLVIVPDVDQPTFDAAEVALVCEIVSPSNAGHDRLLKYHLYAEAGIPWYLLVEPDSETLALTLFRLEDGQYVEHSVAKGGEPLRIAEPISVTLNPGDLLPQSRKGAR